MIFINTKIASAAYHFGAEEYFIDHYSKYARTDGEPIMMLWRTPPTVMLGLNQLAQAEVNFDFCEANDVALVRRRSGGGAIYTDLGTVQFSIIIPFNEYADVGAMLKENLGATVISAMSNLGIDASISGRNDIHYRDTEKGVRKISGLAQFVMGSFICSHCSILYDADIDKLVGSLNVSNEKLESKGVESVRSRVINLKEIAHINYDTNEFIHLLRKGIASQSRDNMIIDIDGVIDKEIQRNAENRFLADQWTLGKNPKYTLRIHKKFPLGNVELALEIKSGTIIRASFSGDYIEDISPLESTLAGVLYTNETIESKLEMLKVYEIFKSLQDADIMELFGFHQ